MTIIALMVMSIITPILTITAFIIGFNVNAQKKIFQKKSKKVDKTEEQTMLERIDEAKVY